MESGTGDLVVALAALVGVVAFVRWLFARLDRRRFEDMRDRPLPHILRESLADLEPRLAEPTLGVDDFDFELWRAEVETGRFQRRRPVETNVRRIRRAG